MKQLFVIGFPISQSKSPNIHNAAYSEMGIDSEFYYDRKEVNLESLEKFMTDFRNIEDYVGLSVTMPLKTAVIKYVDKISISAKETNAVNCIYKENGLLYADNTDIFGITQSLKNHGKESANSVLIFGNGATSSSAKYAAKTIGAKIIKIAGRKGDFDVNINNFDEVENAINNSDLVISTLPWDAAETILPLHSSSLSKKTVLECAFPKKLENSIDGSEMLIFQAVAQIEKWTKKKVTKQTVNAMFNALSVL